MERKSSPVKARRLYDSTRRQEQARLTRTAVVAEAKRRFLDDGYATTTIASIAAGAGVSVDTVYKAFGGKPGLVRAIRDEALGGEGPVHAERRSDDFRAAETDPRKVIRHWGRLTTEVAPRLAPILLLVRAASATDPEMSALVTEMEDDRLNRMGTNAQWLCDQGHLRPGTTFARARDVLFTFSSPELYELLVLGRGWPLADYGDFVADAMIAALFP